MVKDIFERKVMWHKPDNGIFVTFRAARWIPTGDESAFKIGDWVNVAEGLNDHIIVWACGKRETWKRA
jgi:hypothetical protein